MDPEERWAILEAMGALSPEQAAAMRAGAANPSPGFDPAPGMEMPAADGSPVQSGQGLGNVQGEPAPAVVAPEDQVSLAMAQGQPMVQQGAPAPAAPVRVARAGNAFRPLQARTDQELLEAGRRTDAGLGMLDVRAQQQGAINEEEQRKLQDLQAERAVDDAMAAESFRMIEEDREAATNQIMSDYNQLATEVRDAKVVDRRTRGQRVAGAIATALGSIAQGHYAAAGIRMDNMPAKLVQQSIERDLDEQRQALANKRAAMAAKQTELGMARQKFGDTVEAEKMAYALISEDYIRQAEGIRDSARSQRASVAAQTAVDELALKRDMAIEDATRGMQEKVTIASVQTDQRRSEQAAAAKNRMRAARAKAGQVDPKRMAKFAKNNRHFFTSMKRDIPVVNKFLQQKDLDGAGFFGGRTPTRALSKDARKARAAVQGLFQAILRDESGAVIGQDEIVGKGRAAGLVMNDDGTVDWSQNEESIRQGLSRLVQEAELKSESVIAADPEAAAALLGNMDAISTRPRRAAPRGGRRIN